MSAITKDMSVPDIDINDLTRPGHDAEEWNESGAGVDKFYTLNHPEPHRDRARWILSNHPEVKKLFGRTPITALIAVGGAAIQTVVGGVLADASWWMVALCAWFFGAFVNHTMWVVIHEAAHNLVLKGKAKNQLVGMIANLPLVVPVSSSFRIYHLKHHQFQGDYYLDADVAADWEARLAGRSFLGKLTWEVLFPIFQSVRTIRFAQARNISFWTLPVAINFTLQMIYNVAVFALLGPSALLYLALSFLFSIGPHPLGARWIQEHYIVEQGQETYSYYGPLNVLALNVGFHNEHHDFPFIAWNRLPKLKALAPEAYDTLVSHRSWVALWWRFLTDRNITLFSRALRDGRINGKRRARVRGTYAPETLDEGITGTLS